MDQSRDDRIRNRAYELWERDGGRHGDDWSYWLQAEREITLEDTPPSPEEKATAKAKAAAEPFPTAPESKPAPGKGAEKKGGAATPAAAKQGNGGTASKANAPKSNTPKATGAKATDAKPRKSAGGTKAKTSPASPVPGKG